MKSKRIRFLSAILIPAALILLIAALNSNPSYARSYFELLEIRHKKNWVQYNIFYIQWHGRTTEMNFTLYKRTRVAGYPVAGGVGVQWNKTNGEVVGVRDGNTCLVRNGDKFKLALSIFATYVVIEYDNKSVWFYGSGTIDGLEENP